MAHEPIDKGTAGTPSGDTVYEMIDKLDGGIGELFARPIGGGNTIHNGTTAPSNALGVNGDFYINTTGDKTLYGPKAGGVWPSGVTLKGAQGDVGTTGSTGSPGADGKMIRFGTGTPSNALGVDGDFYINTTNDNLFGPKTGGTWGAGRSLVGPQGPPGDDGVQGDPGTPGADGKTVRSGTGAPSGGLGVDGDFYIDTTGDKAVYGPKAGGAWGSPTTLKGAQGIQGDPGVQGDPGDDGAPGDPGAPGVDGRTVLSGTSAPGGGTGANGDFYIKTDTSQLYGPKTAGSWPAPVSLVGAQGGAGSPGADGKTLRSGSGAPAGGLGVDGDFYINTAASTIYGPKASGAWGSPTSIVGPQGTAGTAGKTVLNGTGAPSAGTGVDGDFYIRTDTSQLYGPKAGGAWPGSPVSLVGPQGTTGTAGRTVLNGTAVPGAGVGVDGDFYLKTDTSQLYGPKAAGAWPGSPVSLVGPQGTAGVDGKTLRNGTTAPAGGLGVDGDFYINTTTDEIYGPKTAGAWGSPTALIGPQGIQGDPGAPGTGTTIIRLTADVTDASGANTIQDITGLSFPVVSGTVYSFKFVIFYTVTATTTGSRWSLNGPAASLLMYRSEYSLTTTSRTYNDGMTIYNDPAAASATSAVIAPALNVAIVEGIVIPSANGTIIGRMASEVAAGVIAKAGSFVVVNS